MTYTLLTKYSRMAYQTPSTGAAVSGGAADKKSPQDNNNWFSASTTDVFLQLGKLGVSAVGGAVLMGLPTQNNTINILNMPIKAKGIIPDYKVLSSWAGTTSRYNVKHAAAMASDASLKYELRYDKYLSSLGGTSVYDDALKAAYMNKAKIAGSYFSKGLGVSNAGLFLSGFQQAWQASDGKTTSEKWNDVLNGESGADGRNRMKAAAFYLGANMMQLGSNSLDNPSYKFGANILGNVGKMGGGALQVLSGVGTMVSTPQKDENGNVTKGFSLKGFLTGLPEVLKGLVQIARDGGQIGLSFIDQGSERGKLLKAGVDRLSKQLGFLVGMDAITNSVVAHGTDVGHWDFSKLFLATTGQKMGTPYGAAAVLKADWKKEVLPALKSLPLGKKGAMLAAAVTFVAATVWFVGSNFKAIWDKKFSGNSPTTPPQTATSTTLPALQQSTLSAADSLAQYGNQKVIVQPIAASAYTPPAQTTTPKAPATPFADTIVPNQNNAALVKAASDRKQADAQADAIAQEKRNQDVLNQLKTAENLKAQQQDDAQKQEQAAAAKQKQEEASAAKKKAEAAKANAARKVAPPVTKPKPAATPKPITPRKMTEEEKEIAEEERLRAIARQKIIDEHNAKKNNN